MNSLISFKEKIQLKGLKNSDRLIDVTSGGYVPEKPSDQNKAVFQVNTKRSRKSQSLVISFSNNDYSDLIERSP